MNGIPHKSLAQIKNGASLIERRTTNVPTGQVIARIKRPPCTASPASPILVQCERILIRERNYDSEDLIALARSHAVAIRVKKYYPVDRCFEIANRLIASPLYGPYINALEIGRVGQAFFESQANNESRRRYEENAVPWMAELRALCSPYLSPIDKLRLELDEVWRPGARLMALNGLKAFAGLPRRFGLGAQAEPHQDVLAWDAPASPEAAGLTAQWAMNLHLTAAEKGGALLLFGLKRCREEYERDRVSNSYGVRRETLPDPIAVLQPEAGELIIFDAGLMHAVSKIEAGDRWTWSCFVAYRTANEELGLWS